MRTLRFTQITDSRLEENIKELILQRIAKLEKLFAPIEGVTFTHDEPRHLDWNNVPGEGGEQYRVTCYVTKNTRKVTWESVYELVNSVKACYYEYI